MATRHLKARSSAKAGPKGTSPIGANGLLHLSARRQRRLDDLMAKNSNGDLTGSEQRELHDLVRETEALTLANARALAAGGGNGGSQHSDH